MDAADSDKPKLLDDPGRLIGARVLDFRLTAVIGLGGMSVVYAGTHAVTEQLVAIKVLPPELAVHEELKARFVEEARVLARLEHPNIVHLNNLTMAQGRLCLIMQHVEGITLEKCINEVKRVSPAETTRVAIEVLKALEYAHAQNVVHRDIKPSNIILRSDGTVKVTDFGIAKITGSYDSRLTTTGQTMGTVRYMSPEQVRGKPVDGRCDLYSLGITMYESLTGKTPFDANDAFSIMEQHLSRRPPPVSSHGVEIPKDLEEAIRIALEKDPKDRFADARAFRKFLEEHQIGGEPPSVTMAVWPKKTRRLLWAVPLALALIGGGGAAVLHVLKQPKEEFHGTRAWPAPHPLEGVTFTYNQTFVGEGLRLQSVRPLDGAKVKKEYLDLLEQVRASLAQSELTSAKEVAARFQPPPLNLAIVPQSVLVKPELWPGLSVVPGSTTTSRYVAEDRTLFVADEPGAEGQGCSPYDRALAYGVALHVCSAVPIFSDALALQLAQKFEAAYVSKCSVSAPH